MPAKQPQRFYLLLALLILFVVPTVAILSSCGGPAPTPTAAPPPPTVVPPTQLPATQPPPTPPPTSTTVPPTQPPPTSPPPTPAPTVPKRTGRSLTMFMLADFTGSGTCAVCHTRLVDAAGNDVSIDMHWRSVMMANAARDPLFLAKVSSEIQRAPALQAVLEEKCSLCHMPMAYTQAKVDGTAIALLETGFLNKDNSLHQAAMDGVSCNVCHQIEKDKLGTPESFSGNFVINTATEPPDRASYGPFPDPYGDTMRRSVGFTPLPGLQTLNAALCATCHTLYTPYFDDAGNVAGEFPEQTAFLEWKHSAYDEAGQSCQKCHMPEAVGETLIANSPKPPRISARQPFAQHHFVGGNTFMIRLFQGHVDQLELTCSTEHLDGTLQRTLQQLQEKTLALSLVNAEVANDVLTAVLRLDNLAGHKFPTGFPSRRAWIHFTVKDATGQVIFESGRPQPDGRIVGSAADEDPQAYEVHYDLVSSEDEVQIYESVMQDGKGKVTYTLLGGQSYVKDNRLLPQGFDKLTAGKDFAVYGHAVTDANFVGGSDQVTYQANIKGKSAPFLISVEVLYEAVSYRFSQDLARDDTPLVKEYMAMHAATDKAPVVVARLEQTVK